ncbi:MAG: GxxExxY protein [bacterium]|nr:GxxExxY protein [bacterium]
MDTNYTNKRKIIYPELSYLVNGICFDTHNAIGRFAREKQYCDLLESKFKEAKVPYLREYRVEKTGNIVDFLIDDKIILEVKSKRLILKEDFYQAQRYLQATGKKLAFLVNFRNRYLKPIRVVRIDTDIRAKFV